MREHAARAETAEIEVEVAIGRHELADLDAGSDAAFVQAVRRFETGRVIVAGDIKPAQARDAMGEWRGHGTIVAANKPDGGSPCHR